MPEVNDSFQMNGASPALFVSGPTGAPTMGDPVQGARIVTVQATAVATQDVAIPLPLGLGSAGARVISITAFQNTAPTGATDTMSFGSTVGGVDIAAAQDVKTSANAVAVPAVYRFAAKQFGWAKAKVDGVEATVKADVSKKL